MIQADNFRADPYGWLTNQVSHIGLGVVWSLVACALVLMAFGEFPFRVAIWCIIVLCYVGLVELAAQGWRGADTVEDTIFVTGYGAGSVLYTFHEYKIGTGLILGDVWHALPFAGVAAFHLAVGCGVRAVRKKRQPS